MEVAHGRYHHRPMLLCNGCYEYEVTEQMKEFWNSRSNREQENLINISLKQNRDLRDVLDERMQFAG
jgi:hypothetical protein